MGNWPAFGYPYQGVIDKLNERGGNNSPKGYLAASGGVSGLMPFVRVLSSVGCSGAKSSDGGLVLQSNYPTDGFETRYGSGYTDSGIVGFRFDMTTPVKVKARQSRPSPIVTGINIDESDVGRKKIDFSITCYTLEHMQEVAKHFSEPGFYVLVEWGWNTLKARQQWCSAGSDSDAITPCSMAKYSSWQHVKTKRENSNYTYDAALGLVTTTGIKFGDNESYVLDISLTSLGSVAEYMQSHKGNSKAVSGVESSYTIPSAKTDDDLPTGNLLFRQMFNTLPSHKRNKDVASWEEKSLGQVGSQKVTAFKDFEIDPFGTQDNVWNDESNYINMDSEILEAFLDGLKKGDRLNSTTKGTAGKLEIPSDRPFLSKDRFIRFELAVDILNYISAKQEKSSLCDSEKSSIRIDIDSTICRAFPQIFSTNKQYLYIPNPKCPNFHIEKAFAPWIATDGKFIDLSELGKDTVNIHPPTTKSGWTGTREKNNAGFPNAPHAFPSQYELTEEDNKWGCDSDMVSFTRDREWWGWLKNLYINFDYFNSVISSPNLVIKDVLIELLNSMSSAVNSLWQFEIVQGPHPNHGQECVRVVDRNFSPTTNIDTSRLDENRLQTRGTKSPFIDISFETTTPAAMANSIIQKRLENASDGGGKNNSTHPELGVVPIKGAIFSGETDVVATIVSNIIYQDVPQTEETDTNQGAPATEEPSEDEKRAKAFDTFMEHAGVFMKFQNRKELDNAVDEANDTFNEAGISELENLFVIGTWDDTKLLKQIELLNKGQNVNLFGSDEKEAKAQSAFGTAKINFKVHGVSGFKRGDVLKFDGLPTMFSDPHIWEVTSMSHTIQGDGWYTEVECGMRTNGTVKSGK